jgi:glycosyltransferase involved in cell wall biosynthesis
LKRVLLICNKVPHYRVSVYNYLHGRFLKEGWNFIVASFAMQKESKLGVKFDFREIPFAFAKYRQLVNAVKPDVVMVHLHLRYPLLWLLLHWLKIKGIPVVSWTKGGNLDKPKSKLRYTIFNYCHTLSDALVLYSAKQTGIISPGNRPKIFPANNAVNFEDYPEVPDSKESIRAEFNIPFEKVVLFVGTMGIEGERKKVDHLIQIFRSLERTDVGLILVGSGMSKERQARLNPKNSRYLGQLHDPKNLQISKLFKAADIFVVPGHVGLAVNQAFYWGLPVVTEEGHQPPEIQYLKNGRNGFIVPENDVAALQERMLHLLDNSALRAEFSRNAREDIHKEASIEGMFQGFWKAVRFALARKENRAMARLGTQPAIH